MLDYTCTVDDLAEMKRLYRSATPADLANVDRADDDATAFAEIMMWTGGQSRGWAREARLGTSQGIYLQQHAIDRGLRKQFGETDAQLIARLRSVPDAIVAGAIYAAVAAVILQSGSALPAFLVYVPRDVGAFADTDCFCDMGSRVTNTRIRDAVAIIPAAANARASVLDALRSKLAAGTAFHVEEY